MKAVGKTPQQKKALSYTKDRRVTPGQPNSSAQAVRDNKAKLERSVRHRKNQTLKQMPETIVEDAMVSVEGKVRSATGGREQSKKPKMTALGKAVVVKQKKRIAKGMGRKKKPSDLLPL